MSSDIAEGNQALLAEFKVLIDEHKFDEIRSRRSEFSPVVHEKFFDDWGISIGESIFEYVLVGNDQNMAKRVKLLMDLGLNINSNDKDGKKLIDSLIDKYYNQSSQNPRITNAVLEILADNPEVKRAFDARFIELGRVGVMALGGFKEKHNDTRDDRWYLKRDGGAYIPGETELPAYRTAALGAAASAAAAGGALGAAASAAATADHSSSLRPASTPSAATAAKSAGVQRR